MRRWLTVLLALLVIAAVLITGCGSKTSGGTGPSASPSSQELTGQQMFDKSQAAMQAVKSMSFKLELSAEVQGDPAKVTNAQAKAMLGQPITVSAQGKAGNEGNKADMTMAASAAGQSFDLGLKMDADKIWVSFMNQWYEVPKEMLQGLTGASPSPSASASGLSQQLQEQIKAFGIDPATWSKEFKIVGTESMDGVDVYHVAQTLDVAKMADDLVKVMGAASSLGIGSASPGADAQKAAEDAARIIKESIKDVTVDWYFQKDNFYLRKMATVVSMDFSAQADAQAQGLQSATINLALQMADFDQPVTVEPPAGAKPFQDLMNSLMGSGGLPL